ncbi:MAG: AI-2E family transporter [Candidatus Binataceae bacterium]
MTTELKLGRNIETWIGLAAVGLLILACIVILLPFVSAIVWSVILCVSTWPLYKRLETATRGRAALSSILMVLMLAIVIVGPFVIVGASLASNVSEVVTALRRYSSDGPPMPPAWVATIPLIGARANDYWMDLSLSSATRVEEFTKLLPAAKTLVVTVGGALAAGILELILSLVIAFFVYRDGGAALGHANAVLDRLGGAEARRLLDTAGETVRAVVYGILGTALIQGTLGAIGFWIAGVPGAVFLGFCTFVLATVPVGPPLIWIPAALWLYHLGHLGWAIFMLAWGGLVVSGSDNFVRPMLISRGGPTPLILVMLGVLGGAVAFGFIGIFLGPTLLAVGYSMLTNWAPAPKVID